MSTKRLTCGVEEAAKHLGISRSSAFKAVKDGSLPTIRIGRRLLVPMAKLEALLGTTIEAPPGASPAHEGPRHDPAA